MSDDNVWQPPAANLVQERAAYRGSGSIENGINGNYEFSIGAILGAAWERTKGSKGTLWLAFFFYFAAAVVIGIVFGILTVVLGLNGMHPGTAGFFTFFALSTLIRIAILLPVMMGVFMVAVKLVVRAPVEASEVFSYLGKFLPLVATAILLWVMVLVGTAIFILPGIYLMVAYVLALPLVVDKNLGPWQALEASRKAVTHHWFGFLGLFIAVALIYIVGAVFTLGIGLIWLLPWIQLVFGTTYLTVFGDEGSVAEADA